jgi:hypothetical protein
MKARNFIALAATALLLSACIPSVHPFYTDKEVVFDARLLGEWQPKEDSGDPELWKFEQGEDKSYKLTVTEKKDKQGKFAARLFKLKNQHFLDITPTECELAPDQADLVAASMIPGHLILRVAQIEPELQLAFCDYEWLEKFLKANPKALAHRRHDDALLLTATTRELQRFVLKHLGEEELFQKPSELVRKKN